jgi:D-alanyl-D-alanine carboxypeptidase
MKTKIIMSLLSILSMYNFAQSPEEVKNKIGKLFQKEMNSKNVKDAQFQIYSESLKIDWYFSKNENGEEINQEQPFYTASIGKMFTATSIAILKDEGKLSFSEPIEKFLAEDIMDSLHIYKGKDYSSVLTISQLLQHTSGLPDYFEDKTKDGQAGLLEKFIVNPEKNWEVKEIIDYTKTHFDARFAPGTGYHYTDTEYILLGLIIENISGMPLHEFFEKNIFAPLKMNHTYFNLKSEPISITDKILPFYADNIEVSSFQSLSLDWAGGGVVSTTKDLIRFEVALLNGELVETTTLEQMQNWTNESKGTYYGYGLRKWKLRELFPTLPKLTLIGHSGSTAANLYYCPELDIYMAGSFNQTTYTKKSFVFLVKVLTQLQKIKNQ